MKGYPHRNNGYKTIGEQRREMIGYWKINNKRKELKKKEDKKGLEGSNLRESRVKQN
jgi:hypothetical protein